MSDEGRRESIGTLRTQAANVIHMQRENIGSHSQWQQLAGWLCVVGVRYERGERTRRERECTDTLCTRPTL